MSVEQALEMLEALYDEPQHIESSIMSIRAAELVPVPNDGHGHRALPLPLPASLPPVHMHLSFHGSSVAQEVDIAPLLAALVSAPSQGGSHPLEFVTLAVVQREGEEEPRPGWMCSEDIDWLGSGATAALGSGELLAECGRQNGWPRAAINAAETVAWLQANAPQLIVQYGH